MTFAEASLISSIEHNRSLKRLEKINQVIHWLQVDEILMSHYTVGTGREGADAYSPLMLLKGLLLQKWYRIDSDPELENQINDRISFAFRAGFTRIVKNVLDVLFRQMAFNLFRGGRILGTV
jgi:hypothetical protein